MSTSPEPTAVRFDDDQMWVDLEDGRTLGIPLAWLAPLLNGVEHANFFETRATEYSNAATRGNWGEVRDSFDRRQNAKGSNDVVVVEDGGEDMFARAGVGVE